jgi:1-acyl-sn-glycerol-3-phosphate acyltransferase
MVDHSEGRARRVAATATAWIIVLAARLLTGVRAIWVGTTPLAEQTIYFANHTSHGDFVLLWSTLSADLRATTRPVAGQDYWEASAFKRFIGKDVFNAVIIRRDGGRPKPASTADGATSADPVAQMAESLASGYSLIMFPEGTRNTGDEPLLPLKSGLYHLARACPQVRLVPVWIENLRRVLPKGTLIPIPLACTVRFGAPVVLTDGEEKNGFIERARQAMLELRPEYDRTEGLAS